MFKTFNLRLTVIYCIKTTVKINYQYMYLIVITSILKYIIYLPTYITYKINSSYFCILEQSF